MIPYMTANTSCYIEYVVVVVVVIFERGDYQIIYVGHVLICEHTPAVACTTADRQ
jgi:hypothetical protein